MPRRNIPVEIFGTDGHVLPLEAIRIAVMRRAISEHEGSSSDLARSLGIGRSTLYRFYDGDGEGDEAGAGAGAGASAP
jgi:transcriptional regulator of acetoin/glycerol metabolism